MFSEMCVYTCIPIGMFLTVEWEHITARTLTVSASVVRSPISLSLSLSLFLSFSLCFAHPHSIRERGRKKEHRRKVRLAHRTNEKAQEGTKKNDSTPLCLPRFEQHIILHLVYFVFKVSSPIQIYDPCLSRIPTE